MEKLLQKVAEDPGLHGELFRRLWDGQLVALIEDRPEIRGHVTLKAGDRVVFRRLQDKKGVFVPVFTSEAAAVYALKLRKDKSPSALAAFPAPALFGILNDAKTRIQINPGLSATLEMDPEAVADMVAGKLTHFQPGQDVRTGRLVLHPVPAEKVPERLRQGIRVFCARRPVPIGVYVFHPENEATGEVDAADFRVALRLRSTDNDFYNDFTLMVEKLAPKNSVVRCTVIPPEDRSSTIFLQKCRPLWPLLPAAQD